MWKVGADSERTMAMAMDIRCVAGRTWQELFVLGSGKNNVPCGIMVMIHVYKSESGTGGPYHFVMLVEVVQSDAENSQHYDGHSRNKNNFHHEQTMSLRPEEVMAGVLWPCIVPLSALGQWLAGLYNDFVDKTRSDALDIGDIVPLGHYAVICDCVWLSDF